MAGRFQAPVTGAIGTEPCRAGCVGLAKATVAEVVNHRMDFPKPIPPISNTVCLNCCCADERLVCLERVLATSRQAAHLHGLGGQSQGT